MDIKDKVAVVTGATGGLGWRVCLALAQKGAKLCMVYAKSKKKAEENVSYLASIGVESIAVQSDITNEAGIDKIFNEAVKEFGGVDILVLDAAYNEWIDFKDLETLDAEKWNYIMNFNLTAPYLAARKAAPLMKKRGGGRIVTVSSIGGLNQWPVP